MSTAIEIAGPSEHAALVDGGALSKGPSSTRRVCCGLGLFRAVALALGAVAAVGLLAAVLPAPPAAAPAGEDARMAATWLGAGSTNILVLGDWGRAGGVRRACAPPIGMNL